MITIQNNCILLLWGFGHGRAAGVAVFLGCDRGGAPADGCSGVAAEALQGMTEQVVPNEAGLRRRSGGDLLCEDCWRLMMRQP